MTAELVRNMRRLKLTQGKSEGKLCEGTGVLTMACEQREVRQHGKSQVLKGQSGAREGRTEARGMAERPVVAMKRLTIVEPRGLSSRATQERARARRLA